MSDIVTKIVITLLEQGAKYILCRESRTEYFTIRDLANKELSKGIRARDKLRKKKEELEATNK